MKFTDSSGVASITGAIETVQERWLGVRDRPGLLPSDQKLFRLTRLHQSVRRQQGRCVRVVHGRGTLPPEAARDHPFYIGGPARSPLWPIGVRSRIKSGQQKTQRYDRTGLAPVRHVEVVCHLRHDAEADAKPRAVGTRDQPSALVEDPNAQMPIVSGPSLDQHVALLHALIGMHDDVRDRLAHRQTHRLAHVPVRSY